MTSGLASGILCLSTTKGADMRLYAVAELLEVSRDDEPIIVKGLVFESEKDAQEKADKLNAKDDCPKGQECWKVVAIETIPDKSKCKRCGTKIRKSGIRKGFCWDLTCPYSDHYQDCPAGMAGHPEASGDLACTCGRDRK